MTYQENAKTAVRGDFPESLRFVGNGRAHMVKRGYVWPDEPCELRAFCGKWFSEGDGYITDPSVPLCRTCYVSSALYAEKL